MKKVGVVVSLVVAVLVGCAAQTPSAVAPPPAAMLVTPQSTGVPPPAAPVAAAAAAAPPHACGGAPLTVHFYDVSQALSALVDLPGGRHILVDAGDLSNRAGCGEPCKTAHAHLLSDLATDLGGKPVDLLWVTHQHSDHLGGVADLVTKFPVRQYVDNGRDLDPANKQDKEVLDTRAAVQKADASITVVEPGHTELPLADGGDVHLTAIAPSSWLPKCSSDRNECSIMLRIDYCSSSVLFTGDEEVDEESLIDPHGTVTLLQAGHHGSNTSSGAAFLASVKPKYVVISAGKPDEGSNRGYCHPSKSTVDNLTAALGGPGARTVSAFDGPSCAKGVSHLANFVDVPTSDTLWATERDGDVVLTTTGDGTFTREQAVASH